MSKDDQDNGTGLTFEQAMFFLREGCRITRASFDGDEMKTLCGTLPDKIYGSFYMTIFDVLADDWMVVDMTKKEF